MKSRQNLFIPAFLLLFLLHQDFWFWTDDTLVLGFLPLGLAYHAAYSIAAAVLWGLVVHFAWPGHIQEFGDSAPGLDQNASTPEARDIP